MDPMISYEITYEISYEITQSGVNWKAKLKVDSLERNAIDQKS